MYGNIGVCGNIAVYGNIALSVYKNILYTKMLRVHFVQYLHH